jgi:zinc protease
MAGSFSIAQVTPLIERYIASLPSKGSASSTFGGMRLQFPSGVKKEAVRKGQEPKSTTAISFFADTRLDEMEMHRLRAAASVLEMRLTDIIREEMGGTYGVNVGYQDTNPIPGYGYVQVSFGSAPGNVDTLVAAVMKEIQRLRTEGPSADDIQKVKEIEKRSLETQVRTNGYWISSLQTVHALGWDPLTIARRPQRTESLSIENVGAALKKYFPDNRYTVVTLLPEQR